MCRLQRQFARAKPELNNFFDQFPRRITQSDGCRTGAMLPPLGSKLPDDMGDPAKSHMNKFSDQFADQGLPGHMRMNAGGLPESIRG